MTILKKLFGKTPRKEEAGPERRKQEKEQFARLAAGLQRKKEGADLTDLWIARK